MDLKKIGQEIINGITKVFTEKGVALTDSDPALTNLSTTISNALNEGLKNVPTTESIQNMIDQSIQKATEGDADAISNAITEGTKGLVKADDIKNFISKDDVSKMISQHLGNRSDRKDDANDGKDKKRPSNRFARSSYYPG